MMAVSEQELINQKGGQFRGRESLIKNLLKMESTMEDYIFAFG